jgi:hypothetical protein
LCGGKQGIFLQNCPLRIDEFSGHKKGMHKQTVDKFDEMVVMNFRKMPMSFP